MVKCSCNHALDINTRCQVCKDAWWENDKQVPAIKLL